MGATPQSDVLRRAISLVEMLGPHSMLTLGDIMEEFDVNLNAAKKIVSRARTLGFDILTVKLPDGKHVYRIDNAELRRVISLAAKRTGRNHG